MRKATAAQRPVKISGVAETSVSFSACLLPNASVMRVPLLGAGPIFAVTGHAPATGQQLAFAAALGLLAGFASGLLTLLVYACEDLFQKLPLHWMWWPAIGALFVGVGGIIEPKILGVGYDTIHSLLRGEMLGAHELFVTTVYNPE